MEHKQASRATLLKMYRRTQARGGQRAPGAGFEPTRPETGHGLTCPSDFLSELKAYASILFLKNRIRAIVHSAFELPHPNGEPRQSSSPAIGTEENASDFSFKHFSILAAFVFKDKDKCEYRLVLGQLQVGSRRNRVSLPRAHH